MTEEQTLRLVIQTAARLGQAEQIRRSTANMERRARIDKLVRRWLDQVDWDPRWVLEHPTGHLWLRRAVCGWWL